MAIPTFPQHSGIEGNFAFETTTGEAALPATAHWRVVCESGRVMQDWTEATLVTETTGGSVSRVSVTIEIPGSINTLSDASKRRELKTLVICADKDTDREHSEDFDYYLKRGAR